VPVACRVFVGPPSFQCSRGLCGASGAHVAVAPPPLCPLISCLARFTSVTHSQLRWTRRYL